MKKSEGESAPNRFPNSQSTEDSYISMPGEDRNMSEGGVEVQEQNWSF